MSSLVAFFFGAAVILLDGLVLAMMVRSLLDSGTQRGRGVVFALCCGRLFVVAGALYIALVPYSLSPVWLVAGALVGLAVFCLALVVRPRRNFSLFLDGDLR